MPLILKKMQRSCVNFYMEQSNWRNQRGVNLFGSIFVNVKPLELAN